MKSACVVDHSISVPNVAITQPVGGHLQMFLAGLGSSGCESQSNLDLEGWYKSLFLIAQSHKNFWESISRPQQFKALPFGILTAPMEFPSVVKEVSSWIKQMVILFYEL